MDPAIKKLDRPPLLHQSVQEAIRAYILEHALQPGAPLLPETELARQLGVSRNSVREAVKALESSGVLETRRGSGVFVQEFSFEPLLNNLPYGLMQDLRGLAELLDIRRVLELGMIESAMTATSQEQLGALRGVLERMRSLAERGRSFPEEDREFHRLLFLNLENQMLLKLLDVFWLAFRKASDHSTIDNTDLMRTYRDHVAIAERVAAKDVAGARAALESHYTGIQARLERAQQNSVTP